MSLKRKQKKTKILGLVIVSLLLIVLVLGILFGAGILQLKKGTFEVSFENNGHGDKIESISGIRTLHELPVLEEEGWKFEGWYLDKDLTEKVQSDFQLQKDIILYAKWTKLTNDTICIVSFNSLGGSVVNSKSIEQGKKLIKPIDPVLKDKVFAGWYKDENCSELWDFDVDVVTEDITLYAKWKDIEDSVIEEGEVSIHFLELGNYYAGDSVYIKAGEVDILIDAGSRASSSTTIHNYIKEYCTDRKLEYVIATHAHQDHIAGFVGTSSNPGIFDLYECDVIIDYALKNTTSSVSKNYETARDKEVALGAKHYTAKDCIEGNKGASNIYQITDEISLEILNQKYYYEKTSDENDYSVCVMLHYGDNRFLFTGDLEESGEKSLVQLNSLSHCKVFKGGHHGSRTSSNEILLSKITPEVVCVCCCAGSSEYTDNVDNMFPTQEFINRVAKYTERIYVTSLAKYTIATNKEGKEYPKVNGFTSMNGNIIVGLDSFGEVKVSCTNHTILLKDTEWFNSILTLNNVERKMRTWPTR